MPSTPEGGPRTYAIAAGDADCEHDALSELGGDAGANRYFRCRSCGGVLVRESPMQSEGTDVDLGTVDPRMDDLLADLDHYHDRQPASPLDRAADALRRLLR
ncbi:hypothetical protein [Natronomonas marina]|uniref:hypothetical protein n=1 Tax=Natronomonas marina TaxID=2961939 RepID=UPI0020CA02BA|nr:hypothetical protein [Natronomonas marina]